MAENICLGRETRRFGLLHWRAMHEEPASLLGRFGVHVDVRQPLSRFPTAVQQMVAIARAIAFQAALVVMDEPTSSLSNAEVQMLFGVIRQLRAEGVAVVFVSHKLDELYAVCDRVTVLRDGRTVQVAAMAGLPKLELWRPCSGGTCPPSPAPAPRRSGPRGGGMAARCSTCRGCAPGRGCRT